MAQKPSNVGSVLQALAQGLTPASRCLDVGCGGGNQLAFLPNATGVDRSEENVDYCRGRGLEAVQGDVTELPFPDESFDFVHMSHVLEHIENPIAALRELRRVTQADGLVVVGVPIADSLQRIVLRDDYFRDHEGHLYAFSRREMAVMFEAAGLQTPRVTYDVPFARRFPDPVRAQRIGERLIPLGALHVLSGTMWAIARLK